MLKQLKLNSKLKELRNKKEELEARKKDFEERQENLRKALEEAETEEDINTVNQSVEELEKEVDEAELDDNLKEVEKEINDVEAELNELEKKSNDVLKDEKKQNERGEEKMNKYQVRELIKTGEYYEREDVKEFYAKFKNLRAVTGEGLTVPQVIVNRIMDIMGDYTTLYPLVNKIKVKGTVRILIDTDTTAAKWMEQNAALTPEDVGTITNIDFDGYKVGKVTFVDNSMLQDSIVNLDDYVTKKIARAIALALDAAILNGEGSGSKQPEGIIPQLEEGHKKEVKAGKLVDVLKHIGLIDTGTDSVGEIISVMHRKTYYNRFLDYSINTDSNGNVVGKLPNLTQPDLLGLRVVFNNNMKEDDVLFGDFDEYTLVEREDITIDKSEHAKFAEDQMAFRGKGRFDGKPTNKNAFVLVTIKDNLEG